MAGNTKIEWADSTFNPWIGCTKVSPACYNCYAETLMDSRMHKVKWGAGQPRVRTGVKNWNLPLRWNREPFAGCNECGWRGVPVKKAEYNFRHCGACGHINLSPVRRRVFCASLADVFDNEVPGEWRRDLFALIEATPNLDWLLLTKRIGNAHKMALAANWPLPWPRNVWLGATVVNQEEADRDIPKLLAVPAAKRFLSIEPMLSAIDLTRIDVCNGDAEIYPLTGTTECVNDDGEPTDDVPKLDWVIVGGESGPGARPMHPDWVCGIRDQCSAAGVPFLFKQHGDWLHTSQQPMAHGGPFSAWKWDDGQPFTGKEGARGGMGLFKRVGKAAAGRLLDGRTHDGAPT